MSKQEPKISKDWLADHLKEDEGHNIEAGIYHLPWLNSDSQCNLDVSKMSKNTHAVALGRLGGKVKSEAKAAAVRENGKLGGRPKKLTPPPPQS